MKRYAAHQIYIAPGTVYKQYVIELDDEDRILNLFPLTQEIEATVFYNGMIVPVRKDTPPDVIQRIKSMEELSNLKVANLHTPVQIYRFDKGLRPIT